MISNHISILDSFDAGTTAMLRGYGFACIFVLIAFVALNFYQRDKGFSAELGPSEDPHQVAQEMAHLAPHGVPGNPTIVRNPSNINLENMEKTTAFIPGQQTLNPNPVPVGKSIVLHIAFIANQYSRQIKPSS